MWLAVCLLGLSAAGAALAETPYRSRQAVVLVGEAGIGPGLLRREVLLATVLEDLFELRQFTRGPQRGAGPDWEKTWQKALKSPTEIAPETLAGADLLVLPGWSGATVGTPGGGQQEISNDLTPAEIDTVAAWVREGGGLLVIAQPIGGFDKTNLPALLDRLGLEFTFASGKIGPAVEARGQLAGREYNVALPEGWSWSVEGGQPILRLDERSVGAIASFGGGKVGFLGNGQFFGAHPALGQPSLGALDLADNGSFMMDLLAYLTNRPLLSSAEQQHLTWEIKLLTASLTVAPGDIMNYKPRTPEGSDFAGAWKLLAAADAGRRCDLGPGCVPVAIDAAAKAELERAAGLTDEALAALGEAEAALARQDYARVEEAHARLLASAEAALAAVKPVHERYDAQGQAYYNRPPVDPTVLGLGLVGLTGTAAAFVFRRRRRAPNRS